MTKTPSYMIPLQFPTERYVYGPDIDVAHWTSSPVWSQAVFTRNNPASKYVQSNPAQLRVVAGGKSRRQLKKVPDHIEKTTRRHANKISAIGEKGRWPIGDLYHARLAMIYILSPSHKKVRNKVIAAVKKHYPEYDWQRWLDEHSGGADEIEHLIRRDRARIAANPRSRAKNNSPNRDMFTISRANPMPNPVTGPPYPAPAYVDGVPPTPLTMPTNAGPFLPDMFPYGVGGRVLKVNPRKKYVKV